MMEKSTRWPVESEALLDAITRFQWIFLAENQPSSFLTELHRADLVFACFGLISSKQQRLLCTSFFITSFIVNAFFFFIIFHPFYIPESVCYQPLQTYTLLSGEKQH